MNELPTYACEVCTDAGDWQVSLAGEIDMWTVPQVEAVLRLAQADANTVWIDLRDVSFMDSSGIAMLVRAQHRATAGNTELVVLSPSSIVLRLLELCGMDRALHIAERHPGRPDGSGRRHALIATDLEGVVVQWNRDAELLYGYTAAEALGRPITELTVAPWDDAQAREVMETIRARGEWQGGFEVARADGSTFRAWVRDILISDDEGQPCGLLGLSVPLVELTQLKPVA